MVAYDPLGEGVLDKGDVIKTTIDPIVCYVTLPKLIWTIYNASFQKIIKESGATAVGGFISILDGSHTQACILTKQFKCIAAQSLRSKLGIHLAQSHFRMIFTYIHDQFEYLMLNIFMRKEPICEPMEILLTRSHSFIKVCQLTSHFFSVFPVVEDCWVEKFFFMSIL